MKGTESAGSGFWSRSHHLDRMTFRELVIAYFQYPAIVAYLGCALVAMKMASCVLEPASRYTPFGM